MSKCRTTYRIVAVLLAALGLGWVTGGNASWSVNRHVDLAVCCLDADESDLRELAARNLVEMLTSINTRAYAIRRRTQILSTCARVSGAFDGDLSKLASMLSEQSETQK